VSEPQSGGVYVPKFEWSVGLILRDQLVRQLTVTRNRKVARVEDADGKVRWFRNVRGDAIEVLSL
jgi:hypothetical protein